MRLLNLVLVSVAFGVLCAPISAISQSTDMAGAGCPTGCTCKAGHVNCLHANLNTQDNTIALSTNVRRDDIPSLIDDLKKLEVVK